jgi:hypothetical protein
MKYLLILMLLSGCLTLPHQVEWVKTPSGNLVEVHTDAPSRLEPVCTEPWAGCYDIERNLVFLRSPVLPGTKKHEVAHAEGMRHTAWYKDPLQRTCADVTIPDKGGKYRTGQTICLTPMGEYVYFVK